MERHINNLSLDDRSSNANNQIDDSDFRSNHLQMNFHDRRHNQLHFTSSRMSRDSNLSDTLNNSDFESDLQSRSSSHDQIVDDQIFNEYKKILHRYNSQYGLSDSVHPKADLDEELNFSDPLEKRPFTPSSAKLFNRNKRTYFKMKRTGLRKYNKEDSYYHHFHWIKWVTVAAFIFMVSSGGMYYHHVHTNCIR